MAIRLFECLNGLREGGLRSRRFHQQAARLPLDIVAGSLLNRVKGEWLVPRLSVDAADVATSSLTQGEHYFAASWLGVPLALEAGVRRRMGGLIVPITTAIATTVARRRRGLPLRLTTFGWQVLAVLGGSAIRSYLDRERRVATTRHDEVVAAECEMARLGGRNSVATRADAIVDILIRTGPIIESGAGTTQQMLSSWKAMLASETEQHAVYLKTVFDYWQRRHNEQPDLSRDVYFNLPSKHWTVLLSKTQARDLDLILDGLDLRGTISASVLNDDHAHRPGAPLDLDLDRYRITIPPDVMQRPQSFDLGPAALWLAAVLSAMPSLPTQGAAPLSRVSPAVTWFLGAGLFAHYQVGKAAESARDRVFLACAFGSILHAATVAGALKNPLDESGWARQSYLGPLFAELPLAYLYRRSLSARTKAIAIAATALTVIVGVRTTRSGPKDVLAGLMWPAAALIIFRGLAEAVDSEVSVFDTDLASADSCAVSGAFEEGQRDVVNLVLPAHQSLCTLLTDHRCDHLSQSDIAEVKRRLDDVEIRLSTLLESLNGPLKGLSTAPREIRIGNANRLDD